MEEGLTKPGKSLAAPGIFILVFCINFVSYYLESYKKKKSMSDVDIQLRAEIKQLLKEASSLSQPSTFAQAAKLRRMAAAKEKELAKHQEMHNKNMKMSFGTYEKLLMILKFLIWVVPIACFWNIPVTTISSQLVQPFGKLLSWGAGRSLKDTFVVGIIPWLIVSSRVSVFICKKCSTEKGVRTSPKSEKTTPSRMGQQCRQVFEKYWDRLSKDLTPQECFSHTTEPTRTLFKHPLTQDEDSEMADEDEDFQFAQDLNDFDMETWKRNMGFHPDNLQFQLTFPPGFLY